MKAKQQKFQGPGPGAYSLTKAGHFKYTNVPASSFGVGNRFPCARLDNGPAPGQYEANDPNLDNGARYGFGTGPKFKTKQTVTDTPAPGAYDVKPIREGPRGFSQRGRPKGPDNTQPGRDSPGPGAYAVNMRHFQHGAKYSFAVSRRGANAPRAFSPGPGAYDVRKRVGHDEPKFSIVSRPLGWGNPRVESKLLPGPGTYNANASSFGY